MGSSLHVWDTDAWYYSQVAVALSEGDGWRATSMHVPPLMGWVLCMIGPWQGPSIVVFQSLCLCAASFALLRLGRILGHPMAMGAAVMLLAAHAVGRYGLQGLPDAPFLALHLFLLCELSLPEPTLKRVIPLMLALSLLRYDTLLYMPLYMVFPLMMGRPFCGRAARAAGVAALVALAVMTLWTKARHGVWAPTPRVALLYPAVGEDQLLDSGTTLWREMAALGRPAPQLTESDLKRAHLPGSRETENQDPLGMLSVALWQGGALFDPERLGLLGGVLVLLAVVVSPLSRRLVLVAGLFTLVYVFLGPRERYLSFSLPLWLMVGAGALPRLGRTGLVILGLWILFQVREGAWHLRHPELQPLELRMAGEWIREAGHENSRRRGPVLCREGAPAYYARSDWWRLPLGSKEELIRLVEKEGISYIVADTRFLRNKRPDQAWLLDSAQVPWPCVHVTGTGEGDNAHSALVYEVPGR